METTLYDILNVLKTEYVRFCSESSKNVTAANVVHEFDDVSHLSERRVKQSAINADHFVPLLMK